MPRGRPKGSKNKSKEIIDESVDLKRLKKEIKDLKAKKLLYLRGSIERIELGRELKKLKQQLKDDKEIKVNKEVETKEANDIKEPLIAEILKLESDFPKDLIDLNKYTVDQLQKHIEYIKRKRGI